MPIRPSAASARSLLDSGAGGAVDLIAANAFGSGKIAALLEMRDHVLVEAQAQLDQIAAAHVARAVGPHDRRHAGDVRRADRLRRRYRRAARRQHDQSHLYRHRDQHAAHRSRSCGSTIRARCRCRRPRRPIRTTRSSASISPAAWRRSSRRSTARSARTGLQFSNPAGTTLRVLDDGAGGHGRRQCGLRPPRRRPRSTGGSAELPFFLDGSKPYSGAITAFGAQSLGFAGRIAVNPALLADPSRLVVYQTSPLTAAGDATRPNFLSTG